MWAFVWFWPSHSWTPAAVQLCRWLGSCGLTKSQLNPLRKKKKDRQRSDRGIVSFLPSRPCWPWGEEIPVRLSKILPQKRPGRKGSQEDGEWIRILPRYDLLEIQQFFLLNLCWKFSPRSVLHLVHQKKSCPLLNLLFLCWKNWFQLSSSSKEKGLDSKK
jgi:hypothetical protein